MILGALFIGIAGVLLFAAGIAGARKKLNERRRTRLQRALGEVMTDVVATSHEDASGLLLGLPTRIRIDDDLVTATVTFPEAVLTYEELLERFGSRLLRRRLMDLGALVTRDELVLAVVHEPRTEDSIASLVARLEVAAEVLALREFAPGELLARLPTLRSSAEVDQVLDTLARNFPHAPETRAAFAAAMGRYKDKRLAARAETFFAREASGAVVTAGATPARGSRAEA